MCERLWSTNYTSMKKLKTIRNCWSTKYKSMKNILGCNIFDPPIIHRSKKMWSTSCTSFDVDYTSIAKKCDLLIARQSEAFRKRHLQNQNSKGKTKIHQLSGNCFFKNDCQNMPPAGSEALWSLCKHWKSTKWTSMK